MKTIDALPEIPEGWAWVQGPQGWVLLNPALCAAVAWLAEQSGQEPGFGTPLTGSTVWDPQALDWARYQPEGT
jgi:hypothetical protein